MPGNSGSKRVRLGRVLPTRGLALAQHADLRTRAAETTVRPRSGIEWALCRGRDPERACTAARPPIVRPTGGALAATSPGNSCEFVGVVPSGLVWMICPAITGF
jgi:hypothetical protein